MAVDMLAEAGIAGHHERQQSRSAHVADQTGTAVAGGYVCTLQRLREGLLVEELSPGRRVRRTRAPVLHEDVEVWSRCSQLVAPRDQSLERVVVGSDEAEHQGASQSSSPMTVASR
jgi:hypothetical protein